MPYIIDADVTDDVRRQRLFEGQLFVYSPRASSRAFIEFARELIKKAFEPHDPETAQFHMSVERYAEILGALKPEFIHHPESKRHLCFCTLRPRMRFRIRLTLMCQKCEAQPATIFSPLVLRMPGTLTEIRGIRLPCFRSIGGFLFMTSRARMQWPSTLVIGIGPFRIRHVDTITICGISNTEEVMSRSI